MPQFVDNGRITEAGQKALDWIAEQLDEAGKDAGKLNDLPGFVKHYLVNVRSARVLSEAEWLRDYAASGAQAAYDRATEIEEARAERSALADELDRLREMIEAQAAQIAALQQPAPKKARKQAEPVEEAEPSADDAGAE